MSKTKNYLANNRFYCCYLIDEEGKERNGKKFTTQVGRDRHKTLLLFPAFTMDVTEDKLLTSIHPHPFMETSCLIHCLKSLTITRGESRVHQPSTWKPTTTSADLLQEKSHD